MPDVGSNILPSDRFRQKKIANASNKHSELAESVSDTDDVDRNDIHLSEGSKGNVSVTCASSTEVDRTSEESPAVTDNRAEKNSLFDPNNAEVEKKITSKAEDRWHLHFFKAGRQQSWTN